jgi:peptidoglycan hydrolase-like protein with peptidoglycan-binding domain
MTKPASVHVRYGKTTAYGTSTPATPYLSTAYVKLLNLTPNTTYHFSITATPQDGTPIASSQDYLFLAGDVPTAITPLPLPPSSPSALPPFTKILFKGMKDPQVSLLQELLFRDKLYPAHIVNGSFGPMTERSVKLFQNKYQIPVNGRIEFLSIKKLNELAPKYGIGGAPQPLPPPSSGSLSRTLSLGMSGQDVSLLQKILKKEGLYQGTVTGYFGRLTEQAVKEFQRRNQLAPIGIAGPATRAKLRGRR